MSWLKVSGLIILGVTLGTIAIALAPNVAEAIGLGEGAIGTLLTIPGILPALWAAMGAPFTTIFFAMLTVGVFAIAVMALIRRF